MKKKEDFIIFQSVPVKIRHKCGHIRKMGGRYRFAFVNDYGDIPVARYNYQTGKWEAVENKRGWAYAARNRQMYQNKDLQSYQ